MPKLSFSLFAGDTIAIVDPRAEHDGGGRAAAAMALLRARSGSKVALADLCGRQPAQPQGGARVYVLESGDVPSVLAVLARRYDEVIVDVACGETLPGRAALIASRLAVVPPRGAAQLDRVRLFNPGLRLLPWDGAAADVPALYRRIFPT